MLEVFMGVKGPIQALVENFVWLCYNLPAPPRKKIAFIVDFEI